MSTLLKYCNTIRHLKPHQITGRILYNFKRRTGLIRPSTPPQLHLNGTKTHVPFIHHDPWNNQKEILKGNFTFLHVTHRTGFPPDWSAENMSLLWRYNLHYFHFLYLLHRDTKVELARHWIDHNASGSKPGWDPYPLSLRIVNWIKAGLYESDILDSLYKQASYLYRSIEYFYSGNHLLENARALIFAGIYFNGNGEAENWLATGLKIYREELPSQVLPDGGYYERSPMYHSLILEGILDVLNFLGPEHADYTFFKGYAKEMLDFLVSMKHPDGSIALFNDATTEIAPPPDRIIRYGREVIGYEAATRSSFDSAGYYIIDDDPLYCVIDGGAVGPDHLPAHAHADIFSYELSVAGKKMIVDTGVYEYQHGEMREYVRSTRAHNTVCIDGIDQVECWDSFRVARRYKPYNVTFKNENGCRIFRGSYDGYAHLIGDNIVHSREIKYDTAERNIVVKDIIDGKNTHHVVSRIHLHPDCKVSTTGENIFIQRGTIIINIKSIKNKQYTIVNSWYCPRFGVKLSNKVIEFVEDRELPVEITYVIDFS